jgi:hypothetical protein
MKEMSAKYSTSIAGRHHFAPWSRICNFSPGNSFQCSPNVVDSCPSASELPMVHVLLSSLSLDKYDPFCKERPTYLLEPHVLIFVAVSASGLNEVVKYAISYWVGIPFNSNPFLSIYREARPFCCRWSFDR